MMTDLPIDRQRIINISYGGVWLPARVLVQALHMQEQSFVWFTYLSVQALHMQKAPLARLWRNAEIDRFSRAWLIWCKRA